MADTEHAFDEAEPGVGSVESSRVFPALVAFWFAALLGGGCLFLPQLLFDTAFGDQPPFGPQTRIVLALGAAGLGLLLGLFIASRVRGGEADARTASPNRARSADARAPLDVRSALGLGRDTDNENEDETLRHDESEAYELSDEHFEQEDPAALVRPPIDDPYFASAWSDSDRYDRDPPGEAAAQMPAPQRAVRAATQYNPFAEFLDDDQDPQEAPPAEQEEAKAPEVAEPVAPPPTAPAQPREQAAPPPPAWPRPRAQEPALTDLGVAELVERLARALQNQPEEREDRTPPPAPPAPPRTGQHRHDSALAPAQPAESDVDRAMRQALARLSRLDDVA